jgi:hypothetical protein
MKLHSQIFFFFFLLSTLAWSQVDKSDSIPEIYSFDSLLKLQARFEEFDMYRELNYMRMDLRANNDSNTIWMWTKLSIANSGRVDFHPGETPGSMIEPLRQQFIENSKLNPVRYVLGMAQTAAVGYLAYQHIKKYGLFK